MEKTIREYLEEIKEPEYQKFSSRLLPGTTDILGVRLPKLRSLARKLAKEDWKAYFETALDDSFEERILQGMVIGNIRAEITEILRLAAGFIPKIDNWSVCDSFCSSLKVTEKYRDEVWEFLTPYFRSGQEFEVRFGVVMLLDYYVREDYLDQVLEILDQIRQEGYYVKMAVAWAISICYIRFPERTMQYFGNHHLDPVTYHKALSKIIESCQVSKEEKAKIREMRRKAGSV